MEGTSQGVFLWMLLSGPFLACERLSNSFHQRKWYALGQQIVQGSRNLVKVFDEVIQEGSYLLDQSEGW